MYGPHQSLSTVPHYYISINSQFVTSFSSGISCCCCNASRLSAMITVSCWMLLSILTFTIIPAFRSPRAPIPVLRLVKSLKRLVVFHLRLYPLIDTNIIVILSPHLFHRYQCYSIFLALVYKSSMHIAVQPYVIVL